MVRDADGATTQYFTIQKLLMKKAKKVDRPPVGEGIQRAMCSGRVDPSILKKAKRACVKKYKKGLPSMLETILINEFPGIDKK